MKEQRETEWNEIMERKEWVELERHAEKTLFGSTMRVS